ncbi:hypothetical protein BDR07DRAFT_1488876 [Suillus spraguei]|nr:hypothetical protein BDR07DRAFT_1488876 [Suillus spraguei]
MPTPIGLVSMTSFIQPAFLAGEAWSVPARYEHNGRFVTKKTRRYSDLFPPPLVMDRARTAELKAEPLYLSRTDYNTILRPQTRTSATVVILASLPSPFLGCGQFFRSLLVSRVRATPLVVSVCSRSLGTTTGGRRLPLF